MKKKKKFWEKEKIINFNPLDQIIKVVYTNNINKSRIKRNKKLGKLTNKLSPLVDGLCCTRKHRIYLFITPKSTYGVIAHEAYHGITALFKYIGVDEYDEEIVAYHLGYLIDKIVKFKKKYGRI